MARDFRHFRPPAPEIGSPETAAELQKPANGGLFCDQLRPNRGRPHRLAGGAVVIAPVSKANSLLTGNFTGNLAILRLQNRFGSERPPVLQGFFARFPTQVNRENISKIREFLSRNREV